MHLDQPALAVALDQPRGRLAERGAVGDLSEGDAASAQRVVGHREDIEAHTVPSGEFALQQRPATGHRVAVDGYDLVHPPAPAGPLEAEGTVASQVAVGAAHGDEAVLDGRHAQVELVRVVIDVEGPATDLAGRPPGAGDEQGAGEDGRATDHREPAVAEHEAHRASSCEV